MPGYPGPGEAARLDDDGKSARIYAHGDTPEAMEADAWAQARHLLGQDADLVIASVSPQPTPPGGGYAARVRIREAA